MIYRVGFDLKGDKSHHIAEVSNVLDHTQARNLVETQYKTQRLVRSLVMIDCIELSKSQQTSPVLA